MTNPSQFDHLSATEVSVILNDTKYPTRDVIADFPKHKYVEYYKMFTEFACDYYGLDPLTVSNFVEIVTYRGDEGDILTCKYRFIISIGVDADAVRWKNNYGNSWSKLNRNQNR